MENATKALIIAGAILVSILLVTMGITLLGNTNGLTDSSKTQMSQLEVQEFNGQLEVGIGKSVKGSNVRTMLESVAAKFRDNEDLKSILKVYYNNGNENDIEAILSNVQAIPRYDVSDVEKDPDTGMYKKINIVPKSSR